MRKALGPFTPRRVRPACYDALAISTVRIAQATRPNSSYILAAATYLPSDSKDVVDTKIP